MTEQTSTAAESDEAHFLSGLPAAAASVWSGIYRWPVAAGSAMKALLTTRGGVMRRFDDAEPRAFLHMALAVGRAELSGHAAILPRLVREVFRGDGFLPATTTVDKPAVWENTQVRCVPCGAEYDAGVKADLRFRRGAEKFLKCPHCGGRHVVVTYVRPANEVEPAATAE